MILIAKHSFNHDHHSYNWKTCNASVYEWVFYQIEKKIVSKKELNLTSEHMLIWHKYAILYVFIMKNPNKLTSS